MIYELIIVIVQLEELYKPIRGVYQSRLTVEELSEIESKLGIKFHKSHEKKEGLLYNVQQFEGTHIDLYFIEEDGHSFKSRYRFYPYFLILPQKGSEVELEGILNRKYSSRIYKIEHPLKLDLKQITHLSGEKREYLKIIFNKVEDLIFVKQSINAERELILEKRECDVRYYIRALIDTGLRCGLWYNVWTEDGGLRIKPINRTYLPHIRILAYDIETTKKPLSFPDSVFDQITMISYMVEDMGFLIINREIVVEDIEPFEYTPKPELPGYFHTFNERNETQVLKRFINEILEFRPHLISTFNGDFFDFPFILHRCQILGIPFTKEIGFRQIGDSFKSKIIPHIDCFKWVERDSYLPKGSQGLKAVTRIKLGYDPHELDPEDMMKFTSENPQELAAYSVSDAVATYYLYLRFIHTFIFSLCMIIPLNPDDCSRRGAGFLCECLLMCKAYERDIVFPNRIKTRALSKWYNEHLLISETYVGGKVEALKCGIFRSDLPLKFKLDEEQLQNLSSSLELIAEFASPVTKTKTKTKTKCTNINEIRDKLFELKSSPIITELPQILHLDVAAMYPNIIITNRLQPVAIVDEEICSKCPIPTSTCQRKMDWIWRGDMFTATRGETNQIMAQLKEDMGGEIKIEVLINRLKKYSTIAHSKGHTKVEEKRTAIVCMQENDFYVDTVESFRNRRYEYKKKVREAFNYMTRLKKEGASSTEIEEANKAIILNDSLQLAHKCILNSFYGYVMKRGARWFSMKMAGIVTNTGGKIILEARKFMSKIGISLELDTDGIWCCLPSSFPMYLEYDSLRVSYPCALLNFITKKKFSRNEICTIEFEVDGPYRAMLLPAAREENKSIKKRYAVFNHNGSLAELKGFEVKRRGELKLLKVMQTSIFKAFLLGSTLQECYNEVALIARKWLSIITTRGALIQDSELIYYIAETKNMSKRIEDYGSLSSPTLTAARRLSQIIGPKIIEQKTLQLTFIISRDPLGKKKSQRAIPIQVFSSERKQELLKRWTDNSRLKNFDIRNIIDWDYYFERIGKNLQKIVTIPAEFQNISNPLEEIKHPLWLKRVINQRNQLKIDKFLNSKPNSKPKNKITITTIKGGYVKKLSTKPKKYQKPDLTLPLKIPKESEDFSLWLNYHKKVWLLDRKRSRLDNFFKSGDTTSYNILKVIKTSLGHLLIYGERNLKVYKIRIEIPKILFIGSNNEIFNENLKRVRGFTLPYNEKYEFIYKMEIEELKFNENRKKLNRLFLQSKVYELHLSLVIRFIIEMGCKFSILIKPIGNKFKECKMDLNTKGYKESIEKLPIGFIYHVKTGIISIMMISSKEFQWVGIVGVTPGSEYFTEEEVKYYKTYKQCYKYLLDNIPEVEIVVLCSDKEIEFKYPTIRMNFNMDDYSILNKLDWYKYFKIKEKLTNWKEWFLEMLKLSEYSSIPIGNLFEDSFTIQDIMYLRELKKNRCIIWNNYKSSSSTINSRIGKPVKSTRIIKSGYFLKAIEAEMHYLPIISILESKKQDLGLYNISKYISLMKNLIRKWVQDSQRDLNNTVLDYLLVNFGRWIYSPKNLVFEPILVQEIRRMINRTFQALCKKMKNFGSIIIYGSKNKFIFSSTIEPNIILERLKTLKRFNNLDILIVDEWEKILFKDEWNFIGNSKKLGLIINFDMALQLPQQQQQIFLKTIENFRNVDDEWNTKELYDISKSSNLKSQSLKFIKYITKIASLKDPEKGRKLKMNLLRLIDYSPFSLNSQFIDERIPIIQPDISCSYCSHTRDIDLSRDPWVLFCPSCNNHYDKYEIESLLIDKLEIILYEFYLQEFQCEKCKEFTNRRLQLNCTDSGNFINTINNNSLLLQLNELLRISIKLDLKILKEVINNLN